MPFPYARAAALALTLAIAAGPALAAGSAADPVVAVVNGKEIKKSDVVQLQQTLPQLRQVPLEMVYEQLVDHLVNSRLVTAQARKQKLQDDPMVKERLKDIENQLIQQAYLAKRVDAEVTEDKLRKRYKAFLEENPPEEEVHARHVLLETEEAAKEVIKELSGGKDFAEVAKERSTGPSAQSGGDLGYFAKDAMVPEFAEAAFAMKPGEVSKEPVKTQFGWHVIKVEDRRLGEPPAFEEVKDQLKGEMAEQVVTKLITDLRDKAKVKRFALDGSPLAEAPADAKGAN